MKSQIAFGSADIEAIEGGVQCPHFTRYIGIDYSGAETPDSSCRGLRVYAAEGRGTPEQIQPPPGVKAFSSRNIADAMTIFHLKERRDLSAALRYFCDKDIENAHSALADVRATVEVLEAQLSRYADLPTTVTELAAVGNGGDSQYEDSGRWFVKRGGKLLFAKGTRAQWSEIDGQVMWEEPKWERWPTLKKAKERCEEWRKALAAKGFSQSDLDF